jgi:hypothetical protein
MAEINCVPKLIPDKASTSLHFFHVVLAWGSQTIKLKRFAAAPKNRVTIFTSSFSIKSLTYFTDITHGDGHQLFIG